MTSDFPTRSDESVLFGPKIEKAIRICSPKLDLLNPAFDVVWRRRPTYVIDRNSLHSADRAFADSECSLFRRSLFRLIAPKAFWINPLDGAARAASKLLQYEAACKLGLKVPETLFTNSPEEIRNFLASREEVVYKPLSTAGWKSKDRQFLSYTAVVTRESLVSDALLRQTPGIFQKLVPKAYELRITVMGKKVLAAKILSQQTQRGKLDWRKSYDELQFEAVCLPPDVEQQCIALLDELGLVFGCFDFIVTPSGEYIFLEVNEMGQFLFVERYCGLPLLDAFVQFLLQGNTDFEWSDKAVSIRYGDPDLEAAATAKSRELLAAHVATNESLVDEDRL